MKHLGLALSFALLLPSCLTVPLGSTGRSDADLNPHTRTGMNFPQRVGEFYRRSAWERDDDMYNIHVIYGYRQPKKTPEIVGVQTSRLEPLVALRTKEHYFVHDHPDASRSASGARAAQAQLPGWNIIVFDYQEEFPDYPEGQRFQPMRTLMATKTFHGRTSILQATCFQDSWSTGFLYETGHFAQFIFPHSSSWNGFTQRSYIRSDAGCPGK